jgi:hypothetical protein
MSIPKGTTVTQKVQAVTGVIAKTQFNESYDCLEYLVEYTDSDNVVHSRWFKENEITPLTQGN